MSIATILDEITHNMSINPTMGVNWKVYQDKVKKHEPTYEGMIQDFMKSVFGESSYHAPVSHLELALA